MCESPPPTIIQLREKLSALIIDPARFVLDEQLAECVAMCDWLIEQHPSLTAKFFLRERDA
jgi:hypothetical protein